MAIQGAAERAQANIMAADTELALAEAQARLTAGTSASAAADVRLAAAREARSAAAGEAAIAEEALAVAQGRAAGAATASAAATRTVIGGTGVGLIGLGIVAGVAYGAIKQFQDQVKDDGTLTNFRDHLGLTHAEMLKLTDGVDTAGGHIKRLGDVTVTFGDVMHGVWHEVAREISDPAPWNTMGTNAATVFNWMLGAWSKVSAGISAGLGSMANFIWQMAKGGMQGPDLSKMDPLADLRSRYADELKRNEVAFGGIKASAIGNAEARMQAQADALKADRNPKHGRKEGDHGLQEALDKLRLGRIDL
jgi:hypothetical protein